MKQHSSSIMALEASISIGLNSSNAKPHQTAIEVVGQHCTNKVFNGVGQLLPKQQGKQAVKEATSKLTPEETQAKETLKKVGVCQSPRVKRISSRNSVRVGFWSGVDEEVQILAAELIFLFPRELWTSFRVLSNFDNGNAALLQPLDLSVHDFHGLFHKVKLVFDFRSHPTV
ncbi:hypothetical protein Tco_0624426 [Tanacetum coccineum]|uniref:Uncharacterized protein n=1 Tax=Tanacetum coccineum TaxID=301880 RepID=A0ABQ4WDY7_9ASTR